MLNKNCNYLTSIAISVIISFVFTLLFYTNVITNTSAIFIFSSIFAILSILLLGLFGISDNGLTRQKLCQNCLNLIISIIGNILFSLLSLTIPLRNVTIVSAIIFSFDIFFFIFNFINLIMMLFSIIRYN